jgi:fatty acid desaturase
MLFLDQDERRKIRILRIGNYLGSKSYATNYRIILVKHNHHHSTSIHLSKYWVILDENRFEKSNHKWKSTSKFKVICLLYLYTCTIYYWQAKRWKTSKRIIKYNISQIDLLACWELTRVEVLDGRFGRLIPPTCSWDASA